MTLFRHSLASITPRGFDLAASPPTATVKAAYTKNRKLGVQPLPAAVVTMLQDYLRDRPADAPVWPGTWKERAAKMIRQDLERAGIPYRDADGRFADFHASRHTFVTNLIASRVSVKVAQTLARHSTPTLTLGRYAHTADRDVSAALEGLPILVNPAASLTSQIDAAGTAPAEPINDHATLEILPQGSGDLYIQAYAMAGAAPTPGERPEGARRRLADAHAWFTWYADRGQADDAAVGRRGMTPRQELMAAVGAMIAVGPDAPSPRSDQ